MSSENSLDKVTPNNSEIEKGAQNAIDEAMRRSKIDQQATEHKQFGK